MTDAKTHPAADAFPMMPSERFEELKEDIRTQGLLQPIVMLDGMILDGRNRAKACQMLGIKPTLTNFEGDPWRYVWSLNGTRRDLVAEQRYLIWKHLHEKSEDFQAEKERIANEANKKRSDATKARPRNDDGTLAENEPVDEQSVHRLDKQTPEREAKADASKTNKGAVMRGDKLAKDRPDLAEKVRSGEMKPAEAHRQMKKGEVSAKIEELPADQFTIIYADPPWKYNDSQAVKGDYGTGTGAANSHYPSMTLSELKALDIPSLAADDCTLWLWATCPLLEDALALCKAWGFAYKAQFVWDKVKHNMGHYNSVRHELLLICTKGSATPQVSKLFDSVQEHERTKHSAKPEAFREIIETLYPKGNKIELFRRGGAPDGWSIWGNEAK